MDGVIVLYCAQYVRQKHADDHNAEYPLAAEAVNSCYMDDIIPSADTFEAEKEMRQQLNDFEDKARFHINKSEVIIDTPKVHRAIKVELERREFPVEKI